MLLRLVSVSVALMISVNAFAWSSKGHERLSQSAFNLLNSQERQYFEVRAMALGEHFETEGFVKLSAWVDSVRDLPLAELFARYDAPFPNALSDSRNLSSSIWHYHNQFYFPLKNQSSCSMFNRGQLRQRLIDLEDALAVSREPKQQAILLALFVHLLEDLHQPLHTMASVSSDCRSDLGGNTLCVRADHSGKCNMNLHQLWDQGFGMWDQEIKFHSDPRVFKQALSISEHVDAWLKEGYALRREVYAVKDMAGVDPMYVIRSREHVRSRSERSVERVAWFLKQYYRARNSNG